MLLDAGSGRDPSRNLTRPELSKRQRNCACNRPLRPLNGSRVRRPSDQDQLRVRSFRSESTTLPYVRHASARLDMKAESKRRRLLVDRRGVSTLDKLLVVCILSLGIVAAARTFATSSRCVVLATVARLSDELGVAPPAALENECAAAIALGDPRALAAALEATRTTPPDRGDTTSGTLADQSDEARQRQSAEPFIKALLGVLCPQDKAFLQQLQARGVAITAYDEIYFDDPYYDGTQWTTRRFPAAGTASGTDIEIIRTGDAVEDASTLYHEGVHTGQSSSLSRREREYDAFTKEEAWRISRGLPEGRPGFRTRNARGEPVPNLRAIRAYVNREYPGVTARPQRGNVPDEIIGRTSTGRTVLQRADGSTYTRNPRRGDSYPATTAVKKPRGGIPIDIAALQCP